MQKITSKFIALKIKARCLSEQVKTRLTATSGEGYIDTAIKIIIGVVIGALVIAGLVLLWNNVIMPRLNTEVNLL
ncbi:MAG: DUF6133 family protein [Oscillospiraceae bacterium]|nr:DUF6133 family protein [Oscillospiraceae bacterium]